MPARLNNGRPINRRVLISRLQNDLVNSLKIDDCSAQFLNDARLIAAVLMIIAAV
jgi:hypothetical protein